MTFALGFLAGVAFVLLLAIVSYAVQLSSAGDER